MSVTVKTSDLVAGVVHVLSQYADGNLSMGGQKALWTLAEQVVVNMVTRIFSANTPASINAMIQTPGVRHNIIQFAVSAIASTLMRRGRVFSTALNSLGATCLSKELTLTLLSQGTDYNLFGKD